MKKLFIFGGSGLVGNTLLKKSLDSFEVTATYHTKEINLKNCETIKFDLDKEQIMLRSLLEQESPDIVVNTIAYSNVDLCETDRSGAYHLHVDGTREMVDVCKDIGSKLIYISTDWVFDGRKNHYSENDTPNPINYYGVTRLLAEKEVLHHNRYNVVLRPAIIYGWHPNARFLNFVIDNLKNGKIISAFIDQFATPTLVDDLVDCILNAISLNAGGLYHVTGSTCVNRFEFAKMIAQKFGLNGSLVKPIKASDKPQIAKRPETSCLDNSKASKELGIRFATIDEGLSRVVKQSRIT